MKKKLRHRKFATLLTLLLVFSVISGLFSANTVYADTTDSVNTKWSASLSHLVPTTDGIDISFETIDGIDTVIYTIPENFEASKININAVEDTFKLVGGTYVPGDTKPFAVKLVNNSKYTFSYVPESFTITTEDLTSYIEAGYTSHTSNSYGFDGSPLVPEYIGYRTGNTALQSLYGVTGSNKISDSMVSDESLSAKLVEAGYSNGVLDLNNYYIDFYNNLNGTSVTKLEDFSDDVIAAIFNGNRKNVKETNTEIAELSYNWFYNRLLSIVPCGVSYNDSNTEYTVGAYMRNHSLYDSYCMDAFSSVATGSSASLNSFEMYINGKYTVNSYMNYNFGYFFGMEFERNEGSLEISKIDESGNLIASAAEFILYYLNENGQPMYYTGQTFSDSSDAALKLQTTDGKVTLTNLPIGNYVVKETQSPDGYKLNDLTYDISISYNQLTALSVTNAKIETTPTPTPTPDSPAKSDTPATPSTPQVTTTKEVTPEPVAETTTPQITPPKTGDTITTIAIIAVVSLIGLAVVCILPIKKKNK